MTRATPRSPTDPDLLEARLGSRLAALLQESHGPLPHDVTERLRFAREQALARARREAGAAVVGGGGAAVLGRLGSWWPRLGAALPLLFLVIGLFGVSEWNATEQAQAVAEIDAVLLADDLPPAAYADPGFVAFLKLAEP